MKCEGEIKSLSLDYKTRRPEVTILMDGNIEDIERYTDKRLNIELSVFRRRRSLEANAYFWVLCTRIAEVIGRSVQWVHNDMLRKYGQIELIDGKAVYIVLPDTTAASERVYEAEGYCLRPTNEVKIGRDRELYRTYMMLRGSHEYNSKEMSVLIDGVIQEAKALDIETLTPKQIKEMMVAYGEKHSGD